MALGLIRERQKRDAEVGRRGAIWCVCFVFVFITAGPSTKLHHAQYTVFLITFGSF